MGCLPLSMDEIQRMAVWLEVEVKEEISCWEEIHDSGAHCLQLFLELIHLIMILVKQLLCIETGIFFFFVLKIEGKLENEIQGGKDPSIHICKKYFDLG